MLSHLTALGRIQFARCILGVLAGAFLIFRSLPGEIPYDRLSRLDPGDRAVFLAGGVVFLVLAVARGLVGRSTLKLIRSRSGKENRSQGLRLLRGIGVGAWGIAGLAILAWVVLLTTGAVTHDAVKGFLTSLPLVQPLFQKFPEVPAFLLGGWLDPLVWIVSLGAWVLLGLLALAVALRSPSGRAIRRMGIALAAVDLVDIVAFPFTTACGTYGLLVYRHPDVCDFLEGVFERESTVDS